VGRVTVGILGDVSADTVLASSLDPFRVETDTLDISVRVEWPQEFRTNSGRCIFDSGSTWRLWEENAGLEFDFSAPAFGNRPYKKLLVNHDFSDAILQMNGEVLAEHPYVIALDYPLDELLITHRLTQEKAIELHGSGIVRNNGIANLFVGHSGAGKSTTTRLWTGTEDVEILSDDRIIVRRDEDHSGMETPCGAASLGDGVGILRLRDCSASPTGHSAQDEKLGKRIPASSQDDKTRGAQGDRSSAPADKKHKMRMYGTPWHGEAMFASPNSAPLTRIFVLEHGHGNVITRLSPSQAVAELFARSFVPFHRHEYVDSALVFLEELVDSVPVYRYSFEPDQRAVDKIRHFND
jgi:hypothetical protein